MPLPNMLLMIRGASPLRAPLRRRSRGPFEPHSAPPTRSLPLARFKRVGRLFRAGKYAGLKPRPTHTALLIGIADPSSPDKDATGPTRHSTSDLERAQFREQVVRGTPRRLGQLVDAVRLTQGHCSFQLAQLQ